MPYSLLRRSDQSYCRIEITVYYYINPKSNLREIRVTLGNLLAILRDFYIFLYFHWLHPLTIRCSN
ncbi:MULTISPECIES: hypothetical protein [unclassified Moorena]|uniref:hypothetical protein n=1 Tax=unclassified Moorena TaxID=2683338 RepID=UPI0013FF6483|nr:MULTISPECIES: hypothetical protein [unclassified Moorena]NEO12190.1 hypothetical protein [Moorena sp. SIO3E8]NEP97710.1 hypothetical protein [Moorena sp. SIO3F7]